MIRRRFPPGQTHVEIPTAVITAALAGLGGFGSWLVAVLTIQANRRRDAAKAAQAEHEAEVQERMTFRAALVADIATLRKLVTECDGDRERIRVRLNTAEEQLLVLQADKVIMAKWLEFFKKTGAVADLPI